MCISNITYVYYTIEWFCGDGLPQVCIYSAMIQHCDQTQLEEEKAYFIWQVTVDHHRKPRQALKVETWKQKPKLRPRKNAVYWLIYSFSSASFRIQYRDGTTCSGIGPSPSISNICAPWRCPQTNLIEAIPQLKFPLPSYIKVTIKLTRTLPETGPQEEWVLVGDWRSSGVKEIEWEVTGQVSGGPTDTPWPRHNSSPLWESCPSSLPYCFLPFSSVAVSSLLTWSLVLGSTSQSNAENGTCVFLHLLLPSEQTIEFPLHLESNK